MIYPLDHMHHDISVGSHPPGTSWTRGLQEGRGEETRFVQVAVTLKHFDANSVEGGSTGAMGSHGLGECVSV
jgi:hypothetical protein